MACAFLLNGDFTPSKSVIRIIEQPETQGYGVTFVVPEGQSSLPCSHCLDTTTPACVEYCEKELDLIRLIEQGVADEK